MNSTIELAAADSEVGEGRKMLEMIVDAAFAELSAEDEG